MRNAIVGGVMTVIIGGTAFSVSQSDIAKTFSEQSGLDQTQAETYIKETESELDSFSAIGQDLIDGGRAFNQSALAIDCLTYTYEWESPNLGCDQGKAQLGQLASAHTAAGECYQELDKKLGSWATAKIKECINDSQALDQSLDLPMASYAFEASDIADYKTANAYNRSVLMTALNQGK